MLFKKRIRDVCTKRAVYAFYYNTEFFLIMDILPFSEGDRVVAYCRYSGGDEQGLKNTSTDEQKEAIRRFCEQNKLDLIKVYADPFVSGRSTKGREHYLEMMSDLLHAKKGIAKPVGIVAWDFERLHRNMDQAQLDAARLRMAGYKIYSLQQPVVDNSPFARVMEAMYFASAQNQSDMISADVHRALQSNFKKYKVIPRSNIPDGWIAIPVSMGTFSNGQPRTGYKAEPDPILAPRIRQAIENRLNGATLEEMRVIIGGVFADKPKEYMRRLMLKPLLYGQFTYGGTTMENYCAPIIEKEIFDKLQIYNEYAPKEHERPQGHYSKDRPLLSGLLYCGVCGKKVFINRRKAKGRLYETYYCNDKHIGYRKNILDNLVVSKGIELLSEEKYQEDVKTIVSTLKSPFINQVDNNTLASEINKIDAKIKRILSVLEDLDQPPITLVKRLSELESKRSELASQMESHTDSSSNEKILEECNRIRKSLIEVLGNEKSTTEELRNALSVFIHSVVIYPDNKVLIRHTLPGFAAVASTTSREVTAPPRAVSAYSQLFESLCYA